MDAAGVLPVVPIKLEAVMVPTLLILLLHIFRPPLTVRTLPAKVKFELPNAVLFVPVAVRTYPAFDGLIVVNPGPVCPVVPV